MSQWKQFDFPDAVQEIPRRLSVQQNAYQTSGRYPVIDQGASFIAGYTDDETKVIREHLPLIVFGDHTRALKFVDFPFAPGADGTKLLAPRGGFDALFLYFALKNVRIESRGYNRHFKFLKESKLLAPRSPNEQREVAGTLQAILRSCDVAARRVATLKDLKAATMAKLFREGLRWEPLKQTEIGEIPTSWDVVVFEHLATIAAGLVDPTVPPYASMIHVGPEDVEPGTGRLLSPATAGDLGLISGKYLFASADVVYSKIRPYLQKSILASFEGLCSADMYPLRVRPGNDPAFLHAVTLSNVFTMQAVANQARTGIPKLNRQQLNRIRVPKPHPQEQVEIGKMHQHLLCRIDIEERVRDQMNALFAASLEKIMTGQLRLSSHPRA